MIKRNGKRRGRKPTYPWLEWFGKRGTITVVVRGKDYSCMPHGFSQQARKMAWRLGISLSVYISENGVVTLTNNGKIP